MPTLLFFSSEIQQHSHHRLRRSVDVCSSTLQCNYGGKCGLLSTGKATCFCPIKCSTKDDNPVCGQDRVTYPNLCTVQRYSCIRQRPIEVQYYGPCSKLFCFQVSALTQRLHYITLKKSPIIHEENSEEMNV